MRTPGAMVRGGRPVAVLRVDDQRAGRSPNVCVRSGRSTQFAVRADAPGLPGGRWWDVVAGHALTVAASRLVGRRAAQVVLAIDEPMWRQWRARLVFAVVVTAAGLGALAAGIVTAAGALIGFGAIVAAIGWLLRIRALVQCWVSVELDPGTGLVRLVRAHPAFDQAARELFVRGVGRGRDR